MNDKTPLLHAVKHKVLVSLSLVSVVMMLAAWEPKQSACATHATPAVEKSMATSKGEGSAMSLAEQEATVKKNPLKNAYFGELHLHTAYSLDAYIFGNTLNDPFVAYRFAKGEEVRLPTGVKKRIRAPLDFAAITDHAEALGEYEICTNPDMKGYSSETGQGVRANDIKPFADIFAGISKTPAVRLKNISGYNGFCGAVDPTRHHTYC